MFLLSVFIGSFIFIVASLAADLFSGNRMEKDKMNSYLNFIKGTEDQSDIKRRMIPEEKSDMSFAKLCIYSIPVFLSVFFIMLLSFKSVFMAFILSIFGLIFPKSIYDNQIKKRRELINFQFRDALNSIMASLKAGLSINSAVIKCSDDLAKIYAAVKDKPILNEFMKMNRDLSMGMPINDVLIGFSNRIKLEDVEDFVNSVIIIRQKGGNLVETMENVIKIITEKISIKRDIDILTTGKKTEAKILSLIPVLIIVFLANTSPRYMEPFYGTLAGKVLIIVGFLLLTANYFIGKRIVEIDV